MPESFGQPTGGGSSAVASVSPGQGAAGFTSRAIVFGSSDGALINNSSLLSWDSTLQNLGVGVASPTAQLQVVTTFNGALVDVVGTTAGNVSLFQIESTGAAGKIGVFGVAPVARPSSYTPAGVTTVGSRVMATTITTVAGLMAATEREGFNLLVANVKKILQDLAGEGWLST